MNLRQKILDDLSAKRAVAVEAAKALAADLAAAQAQLDEIETLAAELAPQPATEPAHKQDAAPLPQPQTDAGSAQAATQGAGKNEFREVIEYQDELDQSFENGRAAFKAGAPQDANPHLVMSRYHEHWDAGWLSAQGDAVLYEAYQEWATEGKEPAPIAPGDALPDATGPESDGNVFLRLHPVEQATDAGMVGLPEVDRDQPYFACEATAEPANGTDLHIEHDGTGYAEHKIGEV